MTHRSLPIILVFLILQSCNLGTSGTWKNENIELEKREEIKLLNDKLLKSIINNDISGVKALMSDKLLENAGNNIDKLITNISTSFKADSYKILDQYNVHNSTTGINNTLTSGTSENNDYTIDYLALNKEMYVSLLLPNGLDSKLLITVIYGNYDDQWKINILHFGQYSLLNKTAPDYYNLAKESYNKSYLIDAVNYISLSKQCLRPANEVFKYKDEKEINDFYDKTINEANSKFTFPITITNIDTKPKIFRIFPQMTSEGYFPMVYYLSSINLHNKEALKIENDKVKKEVGALFRGIDKNKKNVIYWVFNEMPDGKKLVEHYGFIDKIK